LEDLRIDGSIILKCNFRKQNKKAQHNTSGTFALLLSLYFTSACNFENKNEVASIVSMPFHALHEKIERLYNV